MRRRLFALLAALVLAAIAAGGCGGSDDGASADATPPVADTAVAGGSETPAEPEGDASAGKAVFAEAGCGNCHTLADAGSSGTVGPNLDDLGSEFETVQSQVENGGGGMPAYEGELSAQQIADVAAYVSSVAGS